MDFLHAEAELSDDGAFEITLDAQANVRILDDENFALYRSGEDHACHGGWVESSPVTLEVPHAGIWHVVIDLGGEAGTVGANVTVLSPARS